jgi:hypothetical protein
MIKFFRRIRQNLLMENKTSKYFKYAIGEIFLVVIGILIALQINNWNENRKANAKEIQFLKSFKVDLLANKDELNRVIEKTETTSRSSDSILQFKSGKLTTLSLLSFVGCIMDATGFTVYQTHEGTTKDIMGSGNLDIISNDSIRLAIGSWQANLKDIREWEALDKNSYAVYNEYLLHNIKLYRRGQKELPLDVEKMNTLLNDDLFLNRIQTRKRFPRILNERYKDEIPKLNRLIDLINAELGNK